MTSLIINHVDKVLFALQELGKRLVKRFGSAGARIRRKKRNSKIRVGIICAPITKYGIVPIHLQKKQV